MDDTAGGGDDRRRAGGSPGGGCPSPVGPLTAGRLPAGLLLAGLVLAGPVAAPAPAAAQVEVIPQAGLWLPVDALGEIESPAGAVELGRAESTLALGLGIRTGAGATAGLRADVHFGTATDVPIRPEEGAEASARSTLLAGTLALELRPFPSLVVARPYLLLGGGLVRRDLDDDDLRDAGVAGAFDEEAAVAARAGLGLDVSFGVVDVLVELQDLISFTEAGEGAEESVQHDLFLMAGLRF